MKTFFLSFPRLSISLRVPEGLAQDVRAAFHHSLAIDSGPPALHEYVVQISPKGLTLFQDGRMADTLDSALELLNHLEESIEVLLIKAVDDWAAFHAGAVQIGNDGWMIAGNPDTGKTTTTFQLIEIGGLFMCEEVCPVAPEPFLIHPYPQVLTMSRSYAEAFCAMRPVKEGKLTMPNSTLARYAPKRAAPGPVPLHVILLPVYDPACTPAIQSLSPETVLTELLSYCFPPNGDDERLFDAVISISERCRIFRLRTNGLQSTRRLLTELAGRDRLDAAFTSHLR